MKPKYTILENGYIERDADGVMSCIPTDPANSDYQEYLNKDKAEQSTPMVTDEASTL